VDKDAVKGILAKYSPPLSPSQMDQLAEDILHEIRSERAKRAAAKRKSKKAAEEPKSEEPELEAESENSSPETS